MENLHPEAESTLVLRRTLPVPMERAFAAWTEAEMMRNWFGPEGHTVPEIEMDVRVGGKYRIGIKPPDGDGLHVVAGTYKEVSPPSRIVFSWQWVNPELDTGETLVTVEFFPKGDGTELVLTHENFSLEKSRENHKIGWVACLDSLEKLLAP